jgi:hypothetical protein
MKTTMKNETKPLALAPAQQTGEGLSTGLSIFDSGAFESLYRVAEALAKSSLVPNTLQGANVEQTAANCLRVVEQSARWQLSPFAVCDCASVVHGRLMWEGKLVAAVIEAQLGIRLSYAYSGSGENRKVIVSGQFSDEPEPRTIEGTVSQWKTTGNGSPWENANNHERQLAYRGAREWARRHAPAVMLGVYTPDEFDPEEMRNVTPRKGLVARETAIDPTETPGTEPEAVAAEAPEPDPQPDPAPETPPATGRQKKERLRRTGALVKAEEKQTKDGKPFWVARFDIGGKQPELTTFSTTLGEALMVMEYGTQADLTIVPGSKPGLFMLEDFEVVGEPEEEGGLL